MNKHEGEKNSFIQRTRQNEHREVVKKYFLVYEGEVTEALYFEAVDNLKAEIGINPLIELVPLIRSYSEEGWSNPKKIVDRVIKNLEESKMGCISYETLLNKIIDYFSYEKIIKFGKIQLSIIWEKLVKICTINLKKNLEDFILNEELECGKILELLNKECDMVNIVNNISTIIKSEDITYEENFDKICIIVDRDKNSFLSCPENNQYEYVLNKCRENGFGFYVTNPCFEFWLLLHFDEVHSLDKNKLLENKKIDAKGRRYAEKKLRGLEPNYKKNRYDAKKMIKNINKAIKNEKCFCEDTEKLESNIGSNIGVLIEEMRE